MSLVGHAFQGGIGNNGLVDALLPTRKIAASFNACRWTLFESRGMRV